MIKDSVPHLLSYISGHGFGHVAQTTSVLNQLRQLIPEIHLTICSTAPQSLLKVRIDGEFDHLAHAADFGMVMASALDVLADESLTAYQALHHKWPQRVELEAATIRKLKPDLVLSNVAYLPLAAAQKAGIPSVAMSSLNWADIFSHYCSEMPASADIISQMYDAYAAAELFLRITPGMPMQELTNIHPIAPVATLGKNRRQRINQQLQLSPHDKLVLASLGGIPGRLAMAHWPNMDGVRWLVSADWEVERDDSFNLESLGMPFIDLLASCDALLCKPGYGSFAEAVCNGIPIIYVNRQDWPEQEYLINWLEQHGQCVEIDREKLRAGQLENALHDLWSQPCKIPIPPDGVEEASMILRQLLEKS